MKTPFDSSIDKLQEAHRHLVNAKRGFDEQERPNLSEMALGMMLLTDGMLDSFIAAKMQMVEAFEQRAAQNRKPPVLRTEEYRFESDGREAGDGV